MSCVVVPIFVTEVALAHSSSKRIPPVLGVLASSSLPLSLSLSREKDVRHHQPPVRSFRFLLLTGPVPDEGHLRPATAFPPREECEECELFPSTLLSKPSTLPLNDFTISRMCLTLSYSVSSSSIIRSISRMRAISLSAAAMEEADLDEEVWIERVVWALSCEAVRHLVSGSFPS